MGEWTWLHSVFPIADIELMSPPIDAKAANVLVRTVRKLLNVEGAVRYEVRVAPHNVSPFRGGPWLQQFTETELENPGSAIASFRALLAAEIDRARIESGK